MPDPISTDTKAEHRFLSVLFCDIIDSTTHLFRSEPEDFGRLLAIYRESVFEIVRQHGGHIARVIGDGVLAYFGWPRGSGRDAEAAVSCGLAVGRRMDQLADSGQLGPGDPIAVRIAVETGWVLVGSLRSADEGAIEYNDVVGHAPNVAARLQRLAASNGIVIGETTISLVSDRFDLERVDTSDLALPAPVQAARVLGRSLAADALRWLGGSADTPFCGRDAELERLTAYWQSAKAGSGQLVLISGEPGLGKSRLAANFATQVRSSAQVLVLTCSQPMSNTTFQPLAGPLRSILELPVDAPAAEILARAERMAARFGIHGGGMHIAAVLGAAGPQASSSDDPAILRNATFRTLLELTVSFASEGPLLLLADDLQWADASTLEFLHRLSERLPTARIMLIVTHRADWAGTWPDGEHVRRMALRPLPKSAALDLVDRFAAGLDNDLKAEIVAKSEGIPFFIQEFARTAGARNRSSRLPGSITQLLAARIDSAGSARILVHYASVIGREIELALLAELAELSDSDLKEQLGRLLELAILVSRCDENSRVVSFQHALLGEAAYEALTSTRRQALHRRVANVLLTRGQQGKSAEPEVLAHHLALAGDTFGAAEHFRMAGAIALRSAAFVETATHARRSLELAKKGSGEKGRLAVLGATVLLGEALSGTHGYASDDVHAVFETANRIALDLGNAVALAPALRGLTAYYQIRGPLSRAHELGRRMVQVARLTGDQLQLADAERRWGWCRFCQGVLDDARLLTESAMRRLEEVTAQAGGLPLVDDTAVRGPIVLALVAWFVDGEAEALKIASGIAERARAYPQPMTTVYGLAFASFLYQLCGKADIVNQLATEAGDIARSRSNAYWTALSDVARGWSETMAAADPEGGLERIRRGVRGYELTQSTILYPYALMLLSEAEEKTGGARAALDALQRGLDCSNAIGADIYLALLAPIRGRLLWDLDREAAEAALADGRAAAIKQGATAQIRRIDLLTSSLRGTGGDVGRQVPDPPAT